MIPLYLASRLFLLLGFITLILPLDNMTNYTVDLISSTSQKDSIYSVFPY